MRLLAIVPLLLASATAAQAFDRFGLTPSDVERLTARPTAWLAAFGEASQGGKPHDLAALRAIMGAKPLPIRDVRELAGAWRCRMIKVGGLLPITPYGFFNCRIAGSGDSASFEKLTGSQRSAGDLLRRDAVSFVFRGVGYTDFVPRRPYGTEPGSDEVGLLFRIAADRLRIEFPAPRHESRYNVMELVRSR